MDTTTNKTNAHDNAKRQVAFKVKINDVLINPYKKEEGWLPNYVTINGKQVSRVNILGVIVSKEGEENAESFVLDDGSGKIPLRFFKPEDFISIGDVVLVIGRPREFGDERYIVPEILKRIKNNGWVEVRKKELMLEMHMKNSQRTELNHAENSHNIQSKTSESYNNSNISSSNNITSANQTNDNQINNNQAYVKRTHNVVVAPRPIKNMDKNNIIEKNIDENNKNIPSVTEPNPNQSDSKIKSEQIDEVPETPQSLILDIIRKLDDGLGVSHEDVDNKSDLDNTDDYIKKLLEAGDIFEVKPGRYKVLE